jgi:hypothetical protein
MSKHSERFHWLAQQFDAIVKRLNESTNLEERKQLLRRMKFLLDKIDGVVFSALERDKQDTPSSPTPDRSTSTPES